MKRDFNKKNKKTKHITNTVFVREGNFEQALRVFRKKSKRSNIRQECKERMGYEKPSAKRREKKRRAIRREAIRTNNV